MSSVNLVAITKPVIEDVDNAEQFIAYAARVSNPGNQGNMDTAPKLCKYLMKNHHWSPFEMVSLTLEINTTRDIARQILRHRSFSFQEFSQRYADASALGFELRGARLQDTKNRQNSLQIGHNEEDLKLGIEWLERQKKILDQVKETYQWALDSGIAKEQARAVLPEGMTHSRLYMAGTLRSWIHYCQLRCANGTQLEHQEIALKCLDILKREFPSLEIEVIQKS